MYVSDGASTNFHNTLCMEVKYVSETEEALVKYIKSYKSIINDKFYDIFNIGDEFNYTLNEFINFKYQINNYGFRGSDFLYENNPGEIWCFGCSWTFGLGVTNKLIWPTIVQNETRQLVRNFGVPGSGPEVCLRLIKFWINNCKHLPDKIYIHGFFDGRLELLIDNETNNRINAQVNSYENSRNKIKNYWKYKNNAKMYVKKSHIQRLFAELDSKIMNIDAIYQQCYDEIKQIIIEKKVDYKLLKLDDFPDAKHSGRLYSGSCGRDLTNPEGAITYLEKNNWKYIPSQKEQTYIPDRRTHPGPAVHKQIANKFLFS